MNSTELLKRLTRTTSAPAITRIVLYDCNTIKAQKNLQSVRALNEHIIGVCADTFPSSVLKCVRARLIRHLGDDVMTHDAPDCETEYNERRDADPSDVSSILLFVSGGLVVAMFVAGGVWNLMKAKDLLQNEGKVDRSV